MKFSRAVKIIRFIAVLLIFSFLFEVSAQHSPVGTYWRHRVSSIRFTTSAQSILAGNCSGIATIATYNASGVVTAVASNLTVNLTGSGTTTFYSDEYCSNQITSVTITTGTAVNSFYFIDTTAASPTITAAGTGYTSGTQVETISTNPFVWTGGGGNSLWATGANWSGGTAPSSAQRALFNGTCPSNCSPTLGANMSVGGVRMAADYAGTITQTNGYTITVGTGGWSQLGGAFTGSTAGDQINMGIGGTNLFAVLGGTFQSTSGTLYSEALTLKLGGPGMFSHNNGTLRIEPAGYNTISIYPSTATFNHVRLGGWSDTYTLNSGTMTVAGNLDLYPIGGGQYQNSGTFNVGGNLTATNGQNGGTAVVRLTGNASGQTITTANSALINNLEIAAGANPVTISGTVQLNGNFTMTSAGTFTPGSILFSGISYGTANIAPGGKTYGNVRFEGYAVSFDFGSATMPMTGDLQFGRIGGGACCDGGTFNNGTLSVGGNVLTTSGQGVVGSVLVKLTGNASGQTITSNGSISGVPNLEIATGANNVTFGSTVLTAKNYTVTSVGTLTTTGSTLYLVPASLSTNSITPGTATYNNVTFYDGWGGVTYNLNAGTFTIGGNLSFVGTGYGLHVNSGVLDLYGNLSSTGSAFIDGSATLNFKGSSNQTVTSVSGSTFPNGNVTVNTTAGAAVVLASNASFNGPSQNFTVTAGSVNQAGYNLTLKGLALGGSTLTKGGGTLTVNGSTAGTGALYGGTVNP